MKEREKKREEWGGTHFEKYPLVTSKALNFESLKEAALMVKEKRHLTTSPPTTPYIDTYRY